jgi:glycosyltransferase involved in cell wall biosynthesis
MRNMPRIAFVTNFIQHYRVRFFERLSQFCDIDFYFFSDGDEFYWLPEHGTRESKIKSYRLRKFKILNTYILPGLLPHLLQQEYDVYFSGIVGRFTLPVTFLAAKITRRPFILWTGIWNRIQTVGHILFFPFTKFIYIHADAIVVYGNHVKQYLISEGVEPTRIFIGQNAIDNDEYTLTLDPDKKDSVKEKLGFQKEQKMILYVGRFNPEKGLDILLHAFSKLGHTDVKLVLVGTGALLEEMKLLATNLGIQDRTVFAGYIPPEQTCYFYANSYFSILPSVTTKKNKETWGLVVNESFAQSVPVIASDCVGAAASGFLENEVTGLIFPEGDIDALTQKMDILLNDPVLRDRLGNQAKLRLLECGLDKMLSGFTDAIQFVLGTPTSRNNHE